MYTLDTKLAKQADEKSNYINEIGKYVGTFKHAVDIQTEKGTLGIEFHFVDQDEKKARFTLYTYNGANEPLYGLKQVNALMTCLSLRSLEASDSTIERFDKNSNETYQASVQEFKGLIDKPIGILFETKDEEYKDRDGNLKQVVKLVPAFFFQAKTELTASEILSKKVKPEQLPKMVASLRHMTLKPSSAKAAQPYSTPSSGGFDSMTDDIPF